MARPLAAQVDPYPGMTTSPAPTLKRGEPVILEGLGGRFYLVGAQKDRFVVVALAVDAERALGLAATTLQKL